MESIMNHKIEMIPVISSNIKALGWVGGVLIYDGGQAKDVLRIEYLNGGIFDYIGVDKEVYNNFLNSESKGSFFHKNIREKYQTIRLN